MTENEVHFKLNRIEILALGISQFNSAFDPSSKAFKLRNPGLLTTWRPEKKTVAETGERVFSSMMGGFKALTADIQAKCAGKNPAIPADSSLKTLLKHYKIETDGDVRYILKYLRNGLNDDTITTSTPVLWFIEA